MSFQSFHLNKLLLKQLYKKSLISSGNTDATAAAQVHFLGNNEKNILVIVNESKARFCTDAELQLLTGIMNACSLSLADIALINQYHTKEKFDDLQVQLKPSIVLLFGVASEHIDLPISFPHYQIQLFNKIQYLCAPPLNMLATDKEQKKLLWASLQKLFKT